MSHFRSIACVVASVSLVSACASNFAAPVEGPTVVEPVEGTPGALNAAATIEVTLPPELESGLTDEPAATDEASITIPIETLVAPSIAMPETVAVVGDSLTKSAEPQVLTSLTDAGLDVVTIDAMESRRMVRGDSGLSSGADVIEDILEVAEPDLWVVALGTNDVASDGSPEMFRTEMQELLALLPAEVPVVWVDLWIRDREPQIRQANQVIRQELQTWDGGAAVVDWYSYGDDDGVIISDGVHLSGSGRQLFADSIAATIEELFLP